jgi:DNA modification methylase
LDPFLGAGTTAIGSINQNRKFIGIEMDKNTLDGANANINDYLHMKHQQAIAVIKNIHYQGREISWLSLKTR